MSLKNYVTLGKASCGNGISDVAGKPKFKFMLLISSLLCWCGTAMTYPVSDHYDGHRFFNPNQSEGPGFWKFVRMATSIRFKKWPDSIENTPSLNLNEPLHADQISITFVNHATVLIRLPGLNILTDPVWSKRVSPFTWLGPKRAREPGINFDALPKIDLVIISHNHYDHMDISTLKRLNARFSPRMLVPLGDKALLNSEGIERVEEMDWWDKTTIDSNTKITFVPTQHFSSRGFFDRNKSLWGSYMIHSHEHLIYFGGDAGYSVHYKEIHDRFGPPDIALLPIGAYEPRWFMQPIHMNPAEAVQAHIDLESKQTIGIHFGTFQLTEEEIDAPVRELKTAVAQANLDARSFIVQPEGVTIIYSTQN